MRVGLCVWKTRLPCVWRVGLRSGATGVTRLENRSCARGGRVALPRDRHCMYTEHEQAQNRPTLRVSRAAGHISESKLAETCNAGCAGAQPYQTRGGERVSEVRFADTPKRRHVDTSPLARRPRLALFIVKHVFAFWRFVSGCNLG